MANEQHISLVKLGSEVWNKWRLENPGAKPDLVNADLREVDLSGANFFMADLTGANLSKANLREADLSEADINRAIFFRADLANADLSKANLRKADFNFAILRNVDLRAANLSDACLILADLSNADLAGANLIGAEFCEANLSYTRMTAVSWERSRMRRKYLGVRGLDSCFGNALFKRDAADQDFLDTLELHWRMSGHWRLRLFRAWGWLDYGRSLWRVAALGIGATSLFAAIFYCWPTLLYYQQSAHTWFTPYYYSVVTFTTLGFGDVRPAGAIGEILAVAEVVVGYVTLGLLLAVLAEKLARRS